MRKYGDIKMSLETKRLYIRPLKESDAMGNYPNWFNDKEVCKYNSHGDTLYTQDMAKKYIQTVNNDDRYQIFAIIDKATQKHIGNISLQSIDKKNKNAEFAIILGEKEFWNKGYAYEASKLILEYGFTTLLLHRIYCGTSILNLPMQKLALKLGFTQEGVLKEAMVKKQTFFDLIIYGIINENT